MKPPRRAQSAPVLASAACSYASLLRSHRCTIYLSNHITVRAGKVRPAGRAGSTIRGGQLLSSGSAGRLTRRLRRRCSHRESPHAPSRHDAHSPRPVTRTKKTKTKPTFHSGAPFQQLNLSAHLSLCQLNSAQLEPSGRSASVGRVLGTLFAIYITQDLDWQELDSVNRFTGHILKGRGRGSCSPITLRRTPRRCARRTS